MAGYRKLGPMRKVTVMLRHALDLYDRDRVRLECGHETNSNGQKAMCSKCALTDTDWRKRNLPRLIVKLQELESRRDDDNAKWSSHLGNGHSCKTCLHIGQLQKIVKG